VMKIQVMIFWVVMPCSGVCLSVLYQKFVLTLLSPFRIKFPVYVLICIIYM